MSNSKIVLDTIIPDKTEYPETTLFHLSICDKFNCNISEGAVVSKETALFNHYIFSLPVKELREKTKEDYKNLQNDFEEWLMQISADKILMLGDSLSMHIKKLNSIAVQMKDESTSKKKGSKQA